MRLAQDLLSGSRLALFSSFSRHPGRRRALILFFFFLSVWQGEDECKVTAGGKCDPLSPPAAAVRASDKVGKLGGASAADLEPSGTLERDQNAEGKSFKRATASQRFKA